MMVCQKISTEHSGIVLTITKFDRHVVFKTRIKLFAKAGSNGT